MNKILQVLVVDDNEEGRMILSKLLTLIKYEVKEAPNGIEVLESLKASKPDLIISNILMPELEGYTLIRELDKAIGGGKIPVVLYSAQNLNEKDKEPSEKLGASRLNIKPAEPKDIIKDIKSILAEFEPSEQKHMKSHMSKNEEYQSKYTERVFKKLEDKVKELEQEIAERKRAEESLKLSEEKYRDLFDNANDAICIVDADLRFNDINTKTLELTGYSKEEILKMGIFDIIPPEQAPRSNEEFEKLQKKGHYEKFIGKIKTKSGNLIDVEINSSAIIEEGRILGSRDIIRDITDRKRAEDALRESEGRLKRAHQAAHLGNWEWDLITNEVYWAEENYRIHGIDPHKVKPSYEAFIQVVDPAEHEFVNKAVTDALADKRSFDIDYTVIRPDNGEICVINSKADVIVDKIGKVVKMVGTVLDITERKRAEKKIEASLKEKEILLREIHHRVKNNMQIISSLLGLTSGTINDKKYADMFRESQNRIYSMSLIHEKLYHSRDLAKIQLNEYIRDLANAIFHSRGVKTGIIELTINIENIQLGIDQSIPLGLIINELITNSLKYAFPGDRNGEIKVSLRIIDENTFELIVSDNGVGIPNDVDFRKTESLGLRLVTILAENQLKGKIDLDRSQGTEFNIKFQGS